MTAGRSHTLHLAQAGHSLAKHDHTVELAVLWVIEAAELPHLIALLHGLKLQQHTASIQKHCRSAWLAMYSGAESCRKYHDPYRLVGILQSRVNMQLPPRVLVLTLPNNFVSLHKATCLKQHAF